MTVLSATVARRVGEGIGPEPSTAGFRRAKEGKLGEDKNRLSPFEATEQRHRGREGRQLLEIQ